MHLMRDPALVDHGRPPVESGGRTLLMGADIWPFLRKVTSGHSWIARWSSWLLGTEIHVSAMSDAWLRVHEDDWNKHGVDV
jgi:hypothetical protein